MPEQYVFVQLDKQRRLRYDLNALAVIQERHGIEALSDDGMAARLGNTGAVDFAFLRTVIWAGLIHEAPELTERDVGGLLSLANITDMTAAFYHALWNATPEGTDEGNAPAAAVADASTGAS